MRGESEIEKVVLLCNDHDVVSSLKVDIQGFKIVNPPEIKKIPVQHHESYALANGEDSGPDFALFENRQKAEKIDDFRKKLSFISKISFAFLITVFIILILSESSLKVTSFINKDKLIVTDKQLSELSLVQTKRDSLLKEVKTRAKFLSDKSRVTILLSEIKNAFPEGLWAEEISLNKLDQPQYRIEIRGLTISSGLIDKLLENIKNIKGIESAKLVYSEQTTVKQNAQALRFKAECLWKQGSDK
jgi:Tfp pilus assembly protein PilN